MTGFVYVITAPSGDHKIGWSRDPVRRLTQINKERGELCRLRGFVKASARQEKELHRLLWAFRIGGEWFRPNKLVEHVITLLGRPRLQVAARDRSADEAVLTTEQFLACIEKHLTERQVKPSRFGKDVLGDPSFVFELRKGRQPNLEVVNRVLNAMASAEAVTV